jgi:hypothetical protein
MGAVDAELTAGGAGGRLAAESLANVLAVHLIRHILAPRRPERGRDGALPRGAAPRRRRVLRGAPRRGPDPGAVGRGRPPQPLPLRAAVQGGHRATAAPVRHRAPRRTGEGAPARRRRLLAGAGRRARRLRGPEPVLPALQAARRRHAGAVPDARKNRINAASPTKKPAGEPLIVRFGAPARYRMREGIGPSHDGDASKKTENLDEDATYVMEGMPGARGILASTHRKLTRLYQGRPFSRSTRVLERRLRER